MTREDHFIYEDTQVFEHCWTPGPLPAEDRNAPTLSWASPLRVLCRWYDGPHPPARQFMVKFRDDSGVQCWMSWLVPDSILPHEVVEQAVEQKCLEASLR